jgi:hypothetical protein
MIYDVRTQEPIIDEIFDDVHAWKNNVGFVVKLGKKENLLREDGTYAWDGEWFDKVMNYGSTSMVFLDSKFALLDVKNKRIINNTWFKAIKPLVNGIFVCYADDSTLILNSAGQTLVNGIVEAKKVSEVIIVKWPDRKSQCYRLSDDGKGLLPLSSMRFNQCTGFRNIQGREFYAAKLDWHEYYMDIQGRKTYVKNGEGYKMIEDLGSHDADKYKIRNQQINNNPTKSFSARDYIKENKKKSNFQMKKNNILNEAKLNKLIKESIKKVLKENQEYPEELYQIGRELQEINVKLSRLSGQYRFEDKDTYEVIRSLQNQLNGVCGDLNTYGISSYLNEGFERTYNQAKDDYFKREPHGMWGMELKNPEGEWEYGDINYDPKAQTMSCMGATIQVDPDMTVVQNLEALYDELVNQGYGQD